MGSFGKAEVVDFSVFISRFEKKIELNRTGRKKNMRVFKMAHERKVGIAVVAASKLRVIKGRSNADQVNSQFLITKIELDLFVSSFNNKWSNCMDNRYKTSFCNSCGHVDNCGLANPYVEIPSWALLGKGLQNAMADISNHDDELWV